MHLLWIFSHPAPYKREFFSLLGKKHDLTVVFENRFEKGRHPSFYEKETGGYREIFLPKRKKSSALLKILKEQTFDLIIMNGWSTIPEMRGICYLNHYKIPYIFLINGGRIKERESFLRKYAKRKFLYSPYAFYLSPDPISSEYLRHYAGRSIPIEEYIYSTVHQDEMPSQPLNKEERKAALKEAKIPGERLYISIGNYIPRKNLFSLLHLWKHMGKDDVLYLFGNGKCRAQYEKYIRENHLTNVFLVGFKTHKEILSYLRMAECSLFPTNEDIYGHAINESLSQGTPVISSPNSNAGLHLIQGKNDGYITSFVDSEAVAKLLKEGLTEKMRESALKVGKENSYEKMLSSFEDILDKWSQNK